MQAALRFTFDVSIAKRIPEHCILASAKESWFLISELATRMAIGRSLRFHSWSSGDWGLAERDKSAGSWSSQVCEGVVRLTLVRLSASS